jgi:hypothetical protein
MPTLARPVRPIGRPARITDQYDSILACEAAAGDYNALTRTRMAGRDQVNTFMLGFGAVHGCQ